MSENTLQWLQIVKFVPIAVFAGLYGFGGISGKWKRRYIAPFVFVFGLCLVSLWVGNFSWYYLLTYPLLVLSLSVGYGGDTLGEKLLKRSRYGALCAMASLPIVFVNSTWTLFGLHVFLCVSVSTILGVWNPTKSARAEETVIGGTIVFLPLFMV